MRLYRQLLQQNVDGGSRELTAIQRLRDGEIVYQTAASGVYQYRSVFHAGNEFRIYESRIFRSKGAVKCKYTAAGADAGR